MNRKYEKIIWLMTILIMAMGLIALYSASYGNVRVSQKVFYDQLFFAVFGLGLMFLLSHINYRKYYDFAYIFYGITLFLLIVVLFTGRHILGAKRWIELGPVNFQPSEFMKVAIILVLARYLSHRGETITLNIRKAAPSLWRDLIIPFSLVLFPMLLIFKQPDLGTAILLFGIFLFMLFASGIRYKYIFGFLTVCLVSLPFAWHILKPYQRDRLLVFLNPNIDPLGAGYTIIQSKIAVGSGRLFGKGWLAGTQSQLNFLPERHTDFIFSVIGEEWGFLGAVLVILCYAILIHAGLMIALQSKDKFGALVAVGIVAIFTLQVIINIGMVIGLCPVVGLTLPLISYGRSSFFICIFVLGILLNLSKHRTIF